MAKPLLVGDPLTTLTTGVLMEDHSASRYAFKLTFVGNTTFKNRKFTDTRNEYATGWTQVKHQWRTAITQRESDFVWGDCYDVHLSGDGPWGTDCVADRRRRRPS